MYRTRNAACLEGYRGFESHPLRHFFGKVAVKHSFSEAKNDRPKTILKALALCPLRRTRLGLGRRRGSRGGSLPLPSNSTASRHSMQRGAAAHFSARIGNGYWLGFAGGLNDRNSGGADAGCFVFERVVERQHILIEVGQNRDTLIVSDAAFKRANGSASGSC